MSLFGKIHDPHEARKLGYYDDDNGSESQPQKTFLCVGFDNDTFEEAKNDIHEYKRGTSNSFELVLERLIKAANTLWFSGEINSYTIFDEEGDVITKLTRDGVA